jgi:hypothetical protein
MMNDKEEIVGSNNNCIEDFSDAKLFARTKINLCKNGF